MRISKRIPSSSALGTVLFTRYDHRNCLQSLACNNKKLLLYSDDEKEEHKPDPPGSQKSNAI